MPKGELMRLVDSDKVVLDATGKVKGRGAHIKKDREVFNLAVAKNHLSRAFRRKINEDEIAELRVQVEEYLKREELKDSKGDVVVKVEGDKVKLN